MEIDRYPFCMTRALELAAAALPEQPKASKLIKKEGRWVLRYRLISHPT